MTEDKAKEKYCPLAPIALGGPIMTTVPAHAGASHGYAAPMRQFACQASACMMWRWHINESSVDSGYCGLAGPTT